MPSAKEQRLAWIKYRAQYERRGMDILSGAFRRIAARIPWGQLTEENYQEVIRANIDQAQLYRDLTAFYRYIISTHTPRSLRLFEDLGKTSKGYRFVKASPVISLLARVLETILLTRAGKFIESIAEDYAAYIIKRIADLLLNSPLTFKETVKAISKETRKKGFYEWQTRRIVRTETTYATNLTQYEAAKKATIVLRKRWHTVIDHRTRQHEEGDLYDHADQDNQVIDLDEFFELPNRKGGVDRLLFPGDQGEKGGRETDPSNTINCRCGLAYIPVYGPDGLPVANKNPG